MNKAQLNIMVNLTQSGVSIFVLKLSNGDYVYLEIVSFEPLIESSTAPINYTVVSGYLINDFVESGIVENSQSELFKKYTHQKDSSKFQKIKLTVSNLMEWMKIQR